MAKLLMRIVDKLSHASRRAHAMAEALAHAVETARRISGWAPQYGVWIQSQQFLAYLLTNFKSTHNNRNYW